MILAILLAVAAGIAVAVQAQLMGTINRSAGTVASTFITYGVGGILAAVIYFASRVPTTSVRQIPWYSWTAGVYGLVIVAGIGYAAPRIGLARTLVVTVAAQLVAAAIIDHLGLISAVQRPIDAIRAAGLLLTVAGVWLVARA